MIKLKDTLDEKWVYIPNFEDYYQVSSLGRLKTTHDRILNPDWELTLFTTPFDFSVWQYKDVKTKISRSSGDVVVFLTMGSGHTGKNARLIDIVAELFVPNRLGYKAKPININGNQNDCRACNIEWVIK